MRYAMVRTREGSCGIPIHALYLNLSSTFGHHTDIQEKLLLLADKKKHGLKRIYYIFAATIKSGKHRIHKERMFKWWMPLRCIVVRLQRTAPKWVSLFQEAVNLIVFILTPTRSCKSSCKVKILEHCHKIRHGLMTVVYLIAVINTRKVLILWEGNKDCLITHKHYLLLFRVLYTLLHFIRIIQSVLINNGVLFWRHLRIFIDCVLRYQSIVVTVKLE